jgi:pilus assembly protein CpaC
MRSTNVDKVPGLGDVPVLGTLFRSSRFQRNETELVIVITPYIVRPVSQASALAVPNDAVQPASDLERIFLGRINTPRTAIPPIGPGAARLKGDVGFMLE